MNPEQVIQKSFVLHRFHRETGQIESRRFFATIPVVDDQLESTNHLKERFRYKGQKAYHFNGCFRLLSVRELDFETNSTITHIEGLGREELEWFKFALKETVDARAYLLGLFSHDYDAEVFRHRHNQAGRNATMMRRAKLDVQRVHLVEENEVFCLLENLRVSRQADWLDMAMLNGWELADRINGRSLKRGDRVDFRFSELIHATNSAWIPNESSRIDPQYSWVYPLEECDSATDNIQYKETTV